jgi:hypothetical protein
MATITRAILDRLSNLERAAKLITRDDEKAWKAAEIEKLELLRREYFDGWEKKSGVWVRDRPSCRHRAAC